MLHIKFQDYRTFGSGEMFLKAFVIYGHGNHLFHVTQDNFYKYMSFVPKEAPQ